MNEQTCVRTGQIIEGREEDAHEFGTQTAIRTIGVGTTEAVAEEWRPIVGYEGEYEVSSAGKIRSLNRIVKYFGPIIGVIIKQNIARRYLCVGLYSGGKSKTTRVHRIVAMAFIPNPFNKPQVNHINGLKTDNRASNLEWNTPSENTSHSLRLGLHINPRKLTSEKASEARARVAAGETQGSVAKSFGVHKTTIQCIIANKTWNALTPTTK